MRFIWSSVIVWFSEVLQYRLGCLKVCVAYMVECGSPEVVLVAEQGEETPPLLVVPHLQIQQHNTQLYSCSKHIEP